MTTETVKHPTHYNRGEFEAWDVLDDWFPNEPLLWQVGKYLSRLGAKDDPTVEVGKMIAYLSRWLEQGDHALPEQLSNPEGRHYPEGCYIIPKEKTTAIEFAVGDWSSEYTIKCAGMDHFAKPTTAFGDSDGTVKEDLSVGFTIPGPAGYGFAADLHNFWMLDE